MASYQQQQPHYHPNYRGGHNYSRGGYKPPFVRHNNNTPKLSYDEFYYQQKIYKVNDLVCVSYLDDDMNGVGDFKRAYRVTRVAKSPGGCLVTLEKPGSQLGIRLERNVITEMLHWTSTQDKPNEFSYPSATMVKVEIPGEEHEEENAKDLCESDDDDLNVNLNDEEYNTVVPAIPCYDDDDDVATNDDNNPVPFTE